MTDQIISHYKELGVVSQNGQAKPLHKFCPKRDICWKTAWRRVPNEVDDAAFICKPWVGEKYKNNRIVAIGENLNGYGGLESLNELVDEARSLIEQGYRRVRFSCKFEEYPGSLLWHRIGCYAAVFLHEKKQLNISFENDGFPQKEYVSNAFEYLAFLEHVKCSPKGDKSQPTSEMWNECGRTLLKYELQILKPDFLLVLGVSSNAWGIRERIYDSGAIQRNNFDRVSVSSGMINGRLTTAYFITHPQAYGGGSVEVLNDLRRAIRST